MILIGEPAKAGLCGMKAKGGLYLYEVYGNMNDCYMEAQAAVCAQADQIDKELYLKYGVKRGLRDLNGKGVLTGLTNISGR
ncbi:MAG: hypothetical protein ACLTSZ_10900 [Lachnospiraceae bacterium]